MRILFVDLVCPKPYDPQVLATEALGGTEGSVIRVAEALAARGHEVRVTQHNRTEVSKFGATYTPPGNQDFKPTHLVMLRTAGALENAAKQFPSARLYIWFHDMFGGPGTFEGFQSIVATQTVPILVSDWHKMQMHEAMRATNFTGNIPARRIYNPIDNNLEPDGTPVDLNKIVFFSSPHKGLELTLKVFERFKDFSELKDVKLYVANPGYFKDGNTDGLRNVVNLGSLPHAEVIKHVRSALAVFHLNNVFPETMGIVHAEANAVGTPFLTSPWGATPEIIDHNQEIIDVADPKKVIDRLIGWKTLSRPKVRGNEWMRIRKIVKEWEGLLGL